LPGVGEGKASCFERRRLGSIIIPARASLEAKSSRNEQRRRKSRRTLRIFGAGVECENTERADDARRDEGRDKRGLLSKATQKELPKNSVVF
jgi:hypothetical protein